MTVFLALRTWWRARRRKLDLEILWPVCKEEASSLDYAKAAFAVHAYNDPAWRDFNEDELIAFIDRLV